MAASQESSSGELFPKRVQQMRLGDFLQSVSFDWARFVNAVKNLAISPLQQNLILMGKETHIGRFSLETREQIIAALKRLKKDRDSRPPERTVSFPATRDLKPGMTLSQLMKDAEVTEKEIELVLFALDVIPSTSKLILMMADMELVRLAPGHVQAELFCLIDALHSKSFSALLERGRKKQVENKPDMSTTRAIKRMRAVRDGKSTTSLHRDDVGLPDVSLE